MGCFSLTEYFLTCLFLKKQLRPMSPPNMGTAVPPVSLDKLNYIWKQIKRHSSNLSEKVRDQKWGVHLASLGPVLGVL